MHSPLFYNTTVTRPDMLMRRPMYRIQQINGKKMLVALWLVGSRPPAFIHIYLMNFIHETSSHAHFFYSFFDIKKNNNDLIYPNLSGRV
jgi:hypothetical protein